MDISDLVSFVTMVGPQWVGYLAALGMAIYVLKIVNRMSTNALHGIADSNQKIELTQLQMVDTLKDLSQEFKDHSEFDAKIFNEISKNLSEQTAMLGQRTLIFEAIMSNQSKIVDGLNRQGEILIKLDERTRESK